MEEVAKVTCIICVLKSLDFAGLLLLYLVYLFDYNKSKDVKTYVGRDKLVNDAHAHQFKSNGNHGNHEKLQKWLFNGIS